MSQKICQSLKHDLESFCAENQLRFQNMIGDGHCLIYSVLHSYFGDLELYTQFIKSIKIEFELNKTEFENFIEKSAKCKINDQLNQYLDNKIWDAAVVDIIPLIISKIIQSKVIIIISNSNTHEVQTISIHFDNYNKSIYVYQRLNHYDALVPSILFN